MANNDYICVYRQFFEEFAKTSQIQDCMPVRVNPYNLSVDELVGEVMVTCVNYLTERKCPRSLVVPLTVIVVEEFINEAKKQPEEVRTPLELNKRTHFKISEVCLRYTDNEKLSSLPSPVKETYYSTHSTKHTRRRMEDRLICLPRFNTLHRIETLSEAGYYGIFDGHSGVTAACYAVSHLHQFLAESDYYPKDPVQAFRQAFEKTELKYSSKDENCGTAALVVLHQHLEKKLTVAWVGDSQAMLVNEDSYVMLVDPHKPERIDERKRIEELGGSLINIQSIVRVNGLLAISRAIGDKKLKPYISAEPEIRVLNLTGSEHFIVMGCDGLWDVVEPHQVIETVYFEVKKHEGQIDSVARRLVDLAKENNSTDNISVIVIFLTDPSEIRNLSLDVTGHRPKILHQDGVIMEANLQTDKKSPLGDSGMNGIYETNGNHFDIQNGSDEDLGPETDVDAVDDVLTSPKNGNPFSKESWQKTGDDNAEKLIEFSRSENRDFGDEFLTFSEGFAESVKPVDDNNSSQSFDVKFDKFPVNNVNPFNTSVDFSCDVTQENNKYMDEINSRKEGANILAPDFGGQLLDLKNETNVLDESQSKNAEYEFYGNIAEGPEQTVPCTTSIHNSNLFFDEDVTSKSEENASQTTVESPAEKKDSDSSLSIEPNVNVKETLSNEKNELQPTNIDENRDVNSGTIDGAIDLIEQKMLTDARGHPPELCSVIDIVEAARASQNLCQVEESENKKDGNESSSELFSPSAPVLFGEAKDEIVAESGGEVEDSEDDEWNYIKVESGSVQNIPTDSKASDLILSPNESPSVGKPTMNSPLNPEADEFIPVSAETNNHEFAFNITPKKAIPGDLTDIIASSPNWNNMNNIIVPEEAAFLNEIKSRPSNIFENVEESPQDESSNENIIDLNNSLNSLKTGGTEKEKESIPLSFEKPHGVDPASDMRGSFIDPSTIDSELPKEKYDLKDSPFEEVVIEKKELILGENAVKDANESGDMEVSSESPDLMSPAPLQEDISPVVIQKPTEAEILTPSSAEPITSENVQSPLSATEEKPADTTQIISPPSTEQPFSMAQVLSETFEKSFTEQKPKVAEIPVSGSAVTETIAAAAADVAAAPVVAKKDVKKPTTKTTSNSTSKAPVTSKPLVNGTKTSAPSKKPAAPMQTNRTSVTGKIIATTTTASVTKTTTTKTLPLSKTQTKSTTVFSTTTKTTPRPRVTSATSAAAKAPASPKTTVTTSPTKSTITALKSVAKTSVSAPSALSSKSKARVPSATTEKRTTSLNGDMKSSVKRTEVIKKTTGSSTTATTTITSTTSRVSSSARPTSTTQKPVTVKTTITTTRTVTAKPRTAFSCTTTTTLSPVTKSSTTARKPTIGAEKQAKEVANRLTSKTGLASKATGVVPGSTATTTTKTGKTSTTTLASKTKNHDKTDTKAEKILEVEVIRSESVAPLNENKTDINVINGITSEQQIA